MSDAILVALLSCAGTLIGSIAGIMTANKLAMYRIEQLERKVEKHNGVADRTLVIERDLKTAFGRIDETRTGLKELREELHERRGTP